MNGPTYPVMDLSKWRNLAKVGNAPTEVVLRKGSAHGEVKADGQDRTLSFTISTASVDRDSDTINPAGWDLRAYTKNPVVLWAHDYSAFPIGKAVEVTKNASRLQARAEFAKHEFADTVLMLLKDGFLKATSVGFRPTKFEFNEKRGGVDFIEQELLEFSIVPVPANPEALIEAQVKGYDPVLLRRCFDGRCGPYIEIMNDEEPETFNMAEFDRMLNGIIREAVLEAVVPAVQSAMTKHTGRIY